MAKKSSGSRRNISTSRRPLWTAAGCFSEKFTDDVVITYAPAAHMLRVGAKSVIQIQFKFSNDNSGTRPAVKNNMPHFFGNASQN